MTKFIPTNKMSKKAQKEANAARRASWGEVNPITKIVPSKKGYNRARVKRISMEE